MECQKISHGAAASEGFFARFPMWVLVMLSLCVAVVTIASAPRLPDGYDSYQIRRILSAVSAATADDADYHAIDPVMFGQMLHETGKLSIREWQGEPPKLTNQYGGKITVQPVRENQHILLSSSHLSPSGCFAALWSESIDRRGGASELPNWAGRPIPLPSGGLLHMSLESTTPGQTNYTFTREERDALSVPQIQTICDAAKSYTLKIEYGPKKPRAISPWIAPWE
jgi:hypothetical protein